MHGPGYLGSASVEERGHVVIPADAAQALGSGVGGSGGNFSFRSEDVPAPGASN
jgi:hypothetical protein